MFAVGQYRTSKATNLGFGFCRRIANLMHCKTKRPLRAKGEHWSHANYEKPASGEEHESSAAFNHRFVHFCARHAASTSDSGRLQTNVRATFDAETRVALEVRRVVASRIYNGKRSNTIIEPAVMEQDERKVSSYCYEHREMTVMDAVKNALGLDK